MESEGFKNVVLTILTENRVMILACLAHRWRSATAGQMSILSYMQVQMMLRRFSMFDYMADI